MDFFESGKRKAITFSYDDGVVQDIRLIELLNRYGLKCTFNLNSERMGSRGILLRDGQRIAHYRLHAEDVKYVYEGHEVAVHTLTHPNLTQLDKDEIIHQVEDDRNNLSDMVQYEVVGMAYPCGGINNDERVAQIIAENAGVKYCRTITCTDSFSPQSDLFRFQPNAYHLRFERMMELGRRFLALDAATPQVLYLWGHSYEMDFASDNWYRLEEFFRLISGKSDIFYGTNREVLLSEHSA